jgi:hypothetical protein
MEKMLGGLKGGLTEGSIQTKGADKGCWWLEEPVGSESWEVAVLALLGNITSDESLRMP